MEQYFLLSRNPSALYASTLLVEERMDADAYNYKYIKEVNKLLNCDILIKPISDFFDIEMLTGFENTKYIEYKDSGVPFVRCKNIRDNFFDEEDLTFIDEKVYNILKRAQLNYGDLLYTKTGSNLGQVCCVPNNMRAIASSNCCFFKKKSNNIIDSHYVSTFLVTKYGKVQTYRAQTKTGQPTIDFQRLKKFVISIPSPEIQKYIGDKVRRAEELREEAKGLKEEMISTLYSRVGLPSRLEDIYDRYSFVGREYLNDFRLDAIYYSNKYIKYEEKLSEKELVSLSDIIQESKYGASISANYHETGIPFLRGLNLSENEINDDIVCLSETAKKDVGKSFVNEGDILITRSGSVGITAVVDKRQDGYAFGSFMIKLVIDKEGWNPYYVSAFLNSIWGKWQIERQKNGAVQQNINLQEIDRIRIPKLNLDIQNSFETLIKNYIKKQEQSRQLIQQAKQDVEDLIEGNFDTSKLNDDTTTESR